MMGTHHAVCGVAAWVAITSPTPIGLGVYPVSPVGVVTGAVVCAGAALLPDIDHHNGTLAHCLPPVSEWVTRRVESLAGGHRQATHSVLGVAVFTLLATLAGRFTVATAQFGRVDVGAGLFAIFLVACALNALFARGWLSPWLISIAVAVLIAVYAPAQWSWLPLAVGLGAGVHVVGDLLTTDGVPLAWPIAIRAPRAIRRGVVGHFWRPDGNLAIPILGDAGSWREWLFAVPVSAYALVGLAALALAPLGVDVGGLVTAAVAALRG